MDPQAPNFPSIAPEVVSTPQIPQTPKDSHGITIAAMALFVLMSLAVVGFLYYQNQQLKTMLAGYQTPLGSPEPSAQAATPDPTANWKTYTNSQFGFEFRYPQVGYNLNTWKPVEGILFSMSMIQNTGQEVSQAPEIGISVLNNPIGLPLNNWLKNYKSGGEVFFTSISNLKDSQIANRKGLTFETEIMGVKSNYAIVQLTDKSVVAMHYTKMKNNTDSLEQNFNQILSTFKFTEATDSASPVATQKVCTMEAKICPDGSAVGRNGLNCEFTPCP